MSTPLLSVLPAAPVDGNALIAVIGTSDPTGAGVLSITQTGANWQRAAKSPHADRTVEIWYALNVAGASATVTVNLNDGDFEGAAIVIEYANLRTVEPFVDKTAGSIGSGTRPNTGTTETTTVLRELWIGGLAIESEDIGSNNWAQVLASNPSNDFTTDAQVHTAFGVGHNPQHVNVAMLSRFVDAAAPAFTEVDTLGTSIDPSPSVDWAGVVATFYTAETYQVVSGLDINVAGTGDMDIAAAFGPVPVQAGLDMWIADGGAASQLFFLDTEVSVPLIVGDHIVNDPGVNVLFSISNLDEDVVSIGLGPGAVGVLSLGSFINNGDGTGSFRATFDPDIPSRQLTIIATDDVDNESNESPIFIVNSFEQVQFSATLTIIPKELVSTATCNRLLDEIPKSGFTLKRQYTLPYSFNRTSFDLRAITPGSPVTITVLRRGLVGDTNETQQYVVIPAQEVTAVEIGLGRGVNIISAIDRFNRSDTIIVAATTYASIMCSYAREIYNFSQVIIEEQEAAIFSPVSTRLAEPLLTITDLLPDVKSQQTLATKLAIRALVSGPGSDAGVRDFLTALTLSTPIFVPQNPDDTLFEPSVRPLYNAQEMFGGVEAHVWPANECVRNWLAFITYINNFDAFQVVSISENEVIFRDDNGDLRRHVFDLTEDRCSLTNLVQRQLCFEAISVLVSLFSESEFTICAVSYPFDARPVPAYPVNPVEGEVENVLGFDPGFDGYADFSLTDRWDGGEVLDGRGAIPSGASGLPTCVFEDGFLVAPLGLFSVDTQIDAFINASGTITVVPAPVAAFLDVSMDLAGVPLTAGMDMSIGLPLLELSLDVAILVQGELELGLSVAITDPGMVETGLQVSVS